jgi:hypothetical protein
MGSGIFPSGELAENTTPFFYNIDFFEIFTS